MSSKLHATQQTQRLLPTAVHWLDAFKCCNISLLSTPTNHICMYMPTPTPTHVHFSVYHTYLCLYIYMNVYIYG